VWDAGFSSNRQTHQWFGRKAAVAKQRQYRDSQDLKQREYAYVINKKLHDPNCASSHNYEQMTTQEDKLTDATEVSNRKTNSLYLSDRK
jgi:ribosomal protein S24E